MNTPNRILKESICTSETIDKLTWFEEVVFYRLLVIADDYGCLDGRIILLRNKLFPTKENVTKKAVEDAIAHLVSVGLLCEYTVSGMPYLFFPTWEKHQRVRNKRRKYPEPPTNYLTATCCQMTATCPPESESNPNLNPNLNPNPKEANASCAKPQSGSTPPVICLPLNDGTEYLVSQEQCHEWAGLYPAVDVIQQLRNMRGWLIGNPDRRKTKRGILRFVTGWLSKEQDRGRRTSGNSARSGTEAMDALTELHEKFSAEES